MDKRTKSRSKVKTYWRILKSTVAGFLNEDSMKYSASLSYYTVFSIGPILVLMIALAGIFYGEDAIEGKVFLELRGLVGSNAAKQIQEVIQNLQLSGKSNLALLISSITLVLGATTVFGDIQNSINKIWHVRAKPKKGWLKLIINRLISFSIVIALGFLLIASLMINGVIVAVTNLVMTYFPFIPIALISWVNTGITFSVIVILFGFIFSFLPDAKVKFRDMLGGAIFTGLLFMLGRYGISIYLNLSSTASFYGAAGSIIVMLLWIYYSAAILYFGAEFTKFYAIKFGAGIVPSTFAVAVEQTEKVKKTGSDAEAHVGDTIQVLKQ